MRERERLEDFHGGHVACRGCKRLLFFDPAVLHETVPVLCCGIAYVPTQRQIDLLLYDRLRPEEWEGLGVQVLPAPAPVTIAPGDSEEGAPESFPASDFEETLVSDAEIEAMAATAEQIAERQAEREAALQRRGPGRPVGSGTRGSK